MVHCVFNKLTLSSVEQFKEILVEASGIAGKIGHYKMKFLKKS